MAIGFQQFNRANTSTTPSFAAATAREAQLENEAEARIAALRSSNMLGAGALYNEGMNAAGKSPISDAVSSYFGDPAGIDPTTSLASANPTGGAMSTMPVELGGGPMGGYPLDAGVLATDVATDVAADVAADTAADVAIDTGGSLLGDTLMGAGADVATDVATDLATDAVVDTGLGSLGAGLSTGLSTIMPFLGPALLAYNLFK